MGSLTLPSAGVVYADTPVFVYSVEKHPQYVASLRPLWKSAEAGTIEIVSSELVLLETLVGPLKKGDDILVSDYEHLFQHAAIRLLPITQPILREAARLRATIPGLHTPDAIHAATALGVDAALFLTNDADFRRIPRLRIAVLSDVAT